MAFESPYDKLREIQWFWYLWDFKSRIALGRWQGQSLRDYTISILTPSTWFVHMISLGCAEVLVPKFTRVEIQLPGRKHIMCNLQAWLLSEHSSIFRWNSGIRKRNNFFVWATFLFQKIGNDSVNRADSGDIQFLVQFPGNSIFKILQNFWKCVGGA